MTTENPHDTLSGDLIPPPEDEFEALALLIPEVKHAEPAERKVVAGLMRQNLVLERADAEEATCVLRLDEPESLNALIRTLPSYTPEEIEARIEELQLTPEEADLESAHWAVRHQARRGELLVHERLIPFQLVRLNPTTFLLLSLGGDADAIRDAFAAAFGRQPDVFSDRALRDPEHIWASWAWCLDPDRQAAQRDADQIRQLWEATAAR